MRDEEDKVMDHESAAYRLCLSNLLVTALLVSNKTDLEQFTKTLA